MKITAKHACSRPIERLVRDTCSSGLPQCLGERMSEAEECTGVVAYENIWSPMNW